jgi:gluconolactonase
VLDRPGTVGGRDLEEDRMTVSALSEQLHELVDPGARVEQVATGFTFTEGPIWMPDGSLHFSDMPADKRRRWHPDEGVTVLRDPSNKCNGMTIDNDGNLIVCEHVTSSVVREHPDGRRETIASHYDGTELNSPNDVIVARVGSIIFTDPTFGRMPVFGVEREQELSFRGVYRLPPGGGGLQLLADDFVQPNGLCLSPDESLLYVNDTTRAHIRVFDVGAEHRLSNGRVFAEGIGDGDLAGGELVDGMKLDERGNVYVTGPRGVWVFSPAGEHLGVIGVPENVGNLNWGGEGWSTLYIPASSSVYRVRLKVGGNRLGYMS